MHLQNGIAEGRWGWRRITLVSALLMLLVACGSGTVEASKASKRGLPGWVMEIPLWKVLPTKHFAVLGEGVVHGRRWAVFAFANERPGARRRPCIGTVTLRYDHGQVSITNGAPSCGLLAPEKPVPVMTEYTFTKVEGMVIGLTLAPSVVRVKMTLSRGPDLSLNTKLLSAQQAEKAKVRQFRYVVRGFTRKACLKSLRGVSETGSTLFQTTPQGCVI